MQGTLGIFLLVTAAMLNGCGQPPGPAAERPGVTQAEDPGAIAQRIVAEMLDITPDDVTVVSIENVQFGDSSLDCPEPGMSYLQVVTPGHRVLVEADGRRFDVRISGGFGRLCRQRKPPGDSPATARSPAVS
jgi:hypothetical protein